MAFVAAPRCTRCEKAVYHAEQVMGPARQIYHKPCLKCEQCGKRLDPGGLVEHDSLPYCARCHTQLYGTRDLRHANVNSPTPTTPSRTPGRSTLPDTPSMISPKPPTPRNMPPPTEYYTPPRNFSEIPTTPSSSISMNLSSSLGRDSSTPITRPNFREPRPIPVPYAGKIENFDERGLIRRNDSPRTKVGEKPLVGDLCWSCEKRVYAAEQVFAVNHKWHRGCLRCVSCKSTLDPSKVSDRDGRPMCKNCYAKEHGPEGIMGKR